MSFYLNVYSSCYFLVKASYNCINKYCLMSPSFLDFCICILLLLCKLYAFIPTFPIKEFPILPPECHSKNIHFNMTFFWKKLMM